MRECSKSVQRRLREPNFINRYFSGNGLDIGGKPDPLILYKELFCRIQDVKTWDWEDGDAQYLATVSDCSLDFVHSSHCLEHLVDPVEGLRNWLRVLRPGGYIIFMVPDEDLYEQGKFPSTFNLDHKWTFTINKQMSWSEKSLNIFELIENLGMDAEPIKIELLNATYRYSLPRVDQTISPIGESGIEVVLRKRTKAECNNKGRCLSEEQPPREIRLHFNQYKDDIKTLKSANALKTPFDNDSAI